MLFVDGGSDRVLIGSSSGLTATFNVNGNAQFSNGTGDVGSLTISPSNDRQVITANSPGSYGNYGVTIKSMRTTGGAAYINNIDLTYQEAVFNQESEDVDFRVESDNNANQLYVDAGNSLTYVGSNTTTTIPSANGFGVKAGGEKTVVLESTAADTLLLFRDSGTTTPPYIGSFGDDLAISGYGGGTPNVGIGITAPQSAFHINENGGPQATGDMTTGLIVSNGTAGTAIQMGTNDAGGYGYIKSAYVNSSQTARALLLYAGTHKAISVESNTVIMNDDSLDRDFRVESDNNTHMLFVDAGNNKAGFNNSSLTNTGLVQMHGTYAATNTADYRDNNVLTLTGNDPGTTADDSGINLAFVPVVGRGSAGVISVETTGTNKEGGAQMRFFTGGGSYPTTLDEKMQLNHNNGVIFNETGGNIDFRVESDANSHFLFVDAGLARLGIGTSGPKGSVHLKDITDFNGSDVYYVAQNTTTNRNAGFKVMDESDNYTSSLTYDNGSNAGILTLAVPSSGNGQLTFNGSDLTLVSNSSSADLKLKTNSTERVRLKATSEVVFNEDSYDYDFRVESDDNANMLFVDANTNYVHIGTNVVSATENGWNFSESIMIGTVNFAGSNEIAVFNQRDGTGTTQIDFRNGNAARGYIEWTTSGTTYNTGSDRRMKENIADADDAGSSIDAIQVRKFDWIDSGQHQPYGMIAQELISIAPDAVSGSEDSEKMMAVDYSRLVPMLIKEIQSLRARVAQLESN